MNAAEWISAIAGVISAIGIVFLWIQTNHLRREIEQDHERSRREKAVDLILTWTERLERQTSSARKLVEILPDTAIVDLVAERPIRVQKDRLGLLLSCLGDTAKRAAIDDKSGMILLDEQAVSTIRWQAMTYLNTLEAVLTSWHHNVADRDMIAEQFGYLVDQTKGYNALERFRATCGGPLVFPGITMFAEELKKRQNKVLEGKPSLGKG